LASDCLFTHGDSCAKVLKKINEKGQRSTGCLSFPFEKIVSTIIYAIKWNISDLISVKGEISQSFVMIVKQLSEKCLETLTLSVTARNVTVIVPNILHDIYIYLDRIIPKYSDIVKVMLKATLQQSSMRNGRECFLKISLKDFDQIVYEHPYNVQRIKVSHNLRRIGVKQIIQGTNMLHYIFKPQWRKLNWFMVSRICKTSLSAHAFYYVNHRELMEVSQVLRGSSLSVFTGFKKHKKVRQ